MIVFPAIDLYDGKAVRLLKGDYARMTVYSNDPMEIARDFERCGAQWVHLVDLEGSRDGTTPNLPLIARIAEETSLNVEVGGGIRGMETACRYMANGVSRIVLGTAAVKDPAFLREALDRFGDRVAVGVDVKGEKVAIHGWTETSELTCWDFCGHLASLGVKTIICTDIAKDGAMAGTSRQLYRRLSERFALQIVASGGVSTLDDIRALRQMSLYGAIVGRAYYTGDISLPEALEAAK